MEISEVREVRVRQGDASFVFLADHRSGRLVVRQEGDDGDEVCAVTVGSREELEAFLTGLRRVLGVGEGSQAGEQPAEGAHPLPPGRPALGSRSDGEPAAPPGGGEDRDDRDAAIERARQRNPQAFKPWTPDEERRLAEAYRQGTPLSKLAGDHERSERAIDMRLQKLGLR